MWTSCLCSIVLPSLNSHVCWVLISAGNCRCLLQLLCWTAIAKLCYHQCCWCLGLGALHCFSLCCPCVPTDLAQIKAHLSTSQDYIYCMKIGDPITCSGCGGKSVLEACSGRQILWGPWRCPLIRPLLRLWCSLRNNLLFSAIVESLNPVAFYS